MSQIGLIGAGGWGTALAIILAKKGHEVQLYARRNEFAEVLNNDRENKKYLPGAKFPEQLAVTHAMHTAVKGADLVLIAVPSHAMRDTVKELRHHVSSDVKIVSMAKGLEKDSFLRMSQVISEELPQTPVEHICALSGPNLAEEVSRGIPTATVVASKAKSVACDVQAMLMTPTLRVYTHHDLIGVETGGALKNIIAISVGIADGLGFGDNTRATLITRGLAEIARLGFVMGGELLTFAGLSGLGDLVCTCTSPHGRNHSAGIRIGRGERIADILAGTDMVIEGVKATQVGYALAAKYQVDLPITRETYQVLYEGKKPADAVISLMAREGKYEIEESSTLRKREWEQA